MFSISSLLRGVVALIAPIIASMRPHFREEGTDDKGKILEAAFDKIFDIVYIPFKVDDRVGEGKDREIQAMTGCFKPSMRHTNLARFHGDT